MLIKLLKYIKNLIFITYIGIINSWQLCTMEGKKENVQNQQIQDVQCNGTMLSDNYTINLQIDMCMQELNNIKNKYNNLYTLLENNLQKQKQQQAEEENWRTLKPQDYIKNLNNIKSI